MAKLIAKASGNFVDSTTWGVVDSTSYMNAENATEVVPGTSYGSGARTQAFTPGAITVDGIAIKLCERNNTNGTISVHLALSATHVEVAGTEVTIDVADLPAAVENDLNGGWIFFKFASPVLLSAATGYEVEAKVSSASSVDLFKDGTSGNICRALRTTTEAAPGAGDEVIITGEKTGQGTQNALTVTMNETATTDYGAAPTAANSLIDPGVAICSGGTLTYGTSSSTNYYLKMSSSIILYAGGTLNIGTTGTPIPRNSTAVLEFDPGADGDYGLIARNLSTLNIQGLSRTSGKNIVACKLNTDEAANSTSLGVDTDTGWLDNDEIVVAATTRTNTQTEKGTLNGNANTSDLTVDGFAGSGGGLLNAHGGGGTTVGSVAVSAEVILLTRNVKIRSATSSIMAYVNIKATASVDIDWAEFYYLGENTNSKRGIEIETTTGSFNMQKCSLHDMEDWGIYISSGSGSNITVSDNVCYNLNSAAAASSQSLNVNASTGQSVITGNYFIGCSASSSFAAGAYIVRLQDFGVNFSNNTVAGCAYGASNAAIAIEENSAYFTGTFDGNVIHSNSGGGVVIPSSNCTFICSNLIGWRNNQSVIYTGISTINGSNNKTIWDTGALFGNTNNNISINNSCQGTTIIKNFTVDGDSTFSTANGLGMGNASAEVYVLNSNFGSNVAHTTADITTGTAAQLQRIALINTTLASSTEVATASNGAFGSYVREQKHDGSSTTHRSLYRTGTIASDQTTRHTASGFSWKMTPLLAAHKLVLPGPDPMDNFKVAVNANAQVTITAYVQKDGSYNGNAPRLVVVGGILSGVSSDVTDSLSVGASTWEQLSVQVTPTEAGVLEYYIDCDGTAGNIYVDDIDVSQA